jgi:uncharacterized protein (UPF0333 family)
MFKILFLGAVLTIIGMALAFVLFSGLFKTIGNAISKTINNVKKNMEE